MTVMTVTVPRVPRIMQSPDMFRAGRDMGTVAINKQKEAGCRITGTML